jgi:aryl-alcohol dehydrogenase-like predicted oxidoreductase
VQSSPGRPRLALRSRVGLGLAALGRPGYINLGHAADLAGHTDVRSLEHNAHHVLDAALDGGVRYFDAARSYGKAEAFLGSWLRGRGVRPGEVTVASKWGYTYTAGWRVDAEVHETKDLSVATLKRQLAETRQLLGEHLSLYQIHSATIPSGVLEDREVLGELARLRQSGVGVGLTVTGPRQRDTIERALAVGRFDAVQATWNLLDDSAGPALAAAHHAGMTVIVKETLANGRLTERGDTPALARVADGLGAGADAVALAAALAQPWADVVLSGASTVAMLHSNLTGSALEISPETLAALAELREEPEDYWEQRSALPWN